MAGSASSATSPSGVQGICPSGWHVPSYAEWTVLTDHVGGANTAGTKLKANSSLWSINTGIGAYGFSALPGGTYYGSGFHNVGDDGGWWSATTYNSTSARSQSMSGDYDYVSLGYIDKKNEFSLRCVMN